MTRALIEAGGQVRILRRRNSPLELIEGLEVDDAIGDILDPASLPTAFQGIEGVVHCTAQMRGSGGPAARLASHERGTRNTLSAATATSVRRYVYISSVAAL
ncbi:MAG TPA: NAD(P)H-binding protein, partial [Anaerolineales bacterium]|nr:NAD(P)H-binding protein [Anaerolineales bacterium]